MAVNVSDPDNISQVWTKTEFLPREEGEEVSSHNVTVWWENPH